MSGLNEINDKFRNKTIEQIQNKPDVFKKFVEKMESDKKSYKTIYNYIRYVITFSETIEDISHKYDFYNYVKPIHINEYMDSLKNNGISTSMRATQWSALNTFFEFLSSEYILENPVSKTNRPVVNDKRELIILTENEIKNLIKQVECEGTARFVNRDLAILKLILTTSLNVSELIQLDMRDVITPTRLCIRKKNDKKEFITICDSASSELKEWITNRKFYFNSTKSEALFLNVNGERLGSDAITYSLKRYAKNVTDKDISVQVLKDSIFIYIYKKTGDIFQALNYMGTEDLMVIKKYVNLINIDENRVNDIMQLFLEDNGNTILETNEKLLKYDLNKTMVTNEVSPCDSGECPYKAESLKDCKLYCGVTDSKYY